MQQGIETERRRLGWGLLLRFSFLAHWSGSPGSLVCKMWTETLLPLFRMHAVAGLGRCWGWKQLEALRLNFLVAKTGCSRTGNFSIWAQKCLGKVLHTHIFCFENGGEIVSGGDCGSGHFVDAKGVVVVGRHPPPHLFNQDRAHTSPPIGF